MEQMDHRLRSGKGWDDARSIRRAREISGSRIGVVGASRTGRRYIDACLALGADGHIYDPYLATDDPVWAYSDEEYFQFAMGHLKRMFPKLDQSWVLDYKVWRSEYAQPVTERNYSSYVPGRETPYANAYISTMAQIYPED
ncbi:NAD(P)-dependent oxidoreductase, partial [Bacillus sp. SIMBA_026]|uniref:NAD(P)-dependent oxidoreductase n=1 Tax=Bacillus sp. SIMBA_026 TaxID=3085769 RepID=UPI0039783E14